jgi:hypothetical protein
MKRYFTLAVFASVLLLSACSYTSNFVVLNESGKPIRVRYKLKTSAYEPFQLIAEPARVSESNLRNRDREWQVLKSSEYHLDRESRTITVDLPPHEALRVLYITNYRGHDDASGADRFEIDEIVISGASGEVAIQGDQTRKKFAEESESLYVWAYK